MHFPCAGHFRQHIEPCADIFTAFYRGSNARADASSGSGLGMTIVRGLVEGHTGTVTLTATPGGGATVSVRLPSNGAPLPSSNGHEVRPPGEVSLPR